MPAKFDKEFKTNAVRLVVEDGVSVSSASKDLGVGLSTLQRWVRELKAHGKTAFPGKGHLRPEDAGNITALPTHSISLTGTASASAANTQSA